MKQKNIHSEGPMDNLKRKQKSMVYNTNNHTFQYSSVKEEKYNKSLYNSKINDYSIHSNNSQNSNNSYSNKQIREPQHLKQSQQHQSNVYYNQYSSLAEKNQNFRVNDNNIPYSSTYIDHVQTSESEDIVNLVEVERPVKQKQYHSVLMSNVSNPPAKGDREMNIQNNEYYNQDYSREIDGFDGSRSNAHNKSGYSDHRENNIGKKNSDMNRNEVRTKYTDLKQEKEPLSTRNNKGTGSNNLRVPTSSGTAVKPSKIYDKYKGMIKKFK